MPLDVAALVLLGALLNATWNAFLKAGSDKTLDAIMVALGAALLSLPALVIFGLPPLGLMPYILASVALQSVYYRLIAAAYSVGDIGLVYPLMRGGAVLLIALSSGGLLAEHLPVNVWAGIMAITGGVVTMAIDARGSGKALLIAASNACIIAAYTIVDGLGARASGNPVAYVFWISVLPPVPLMLWAIWRHGRAKVASHIRTQWHRGVLAGSGATASYILALWAMTRAPVAVVAALRETSIVFATIIAVVFLKEKPSPARLIGAGTIALGALVLKLG